MIVSKQDLSRVLDRISKKEWVSIDCETTGIRVHHGDRLFSIALCDDEDTYYFNFQEYEGINQDLVLERSAVSEIVDALPNKICNHNIKFDLHVLANEGIPLDKLTSFFIHDTMVVQRILRNDALKLSLEAVAPEVGEEKDSAVEDYIKKHKLYDVTTIPGKKTRYKNLHYYKVPFEVISKYAQQDAKISYKLCQKQIGTINGWDSEPDSKKIDPLYRRECELVKICFKIERDGIAINYPYIEQAIKEETRRVEAAKNAIEKEINKPFVDSRKELEQIFPHAEVRRTLKGNKSYDEESLKHIDSPVARQIEIYREHLKRKNTYFESFRYHSTPDNKIHPTLNQHAAQTGRFSIKDPALQTLNKEEDKTNPFPIRRSFVPRQGNCFVEMDYKSMEFVLMCDYACEKTLIEALKNGHDPHKATAELVRSTRREAKTLNFLLIYGGSVVALALALFDVTVDETSLFAIWKDYNEWRLDEKEEKALTSLNVMQYEENLKLLLESEKLYKKYFLALPAVDSFLRKVKKKAKSRGYVFNVFGRRFHFTNPKFSYKAPNALIQGTGADTCKKAIVDCFELLRGYESKIVLQNHDAILFDMPPKEFFLIPLLKKAMEDAYPFRHIPLTVSIEHSWESWGDLKEGVPVGRKTGESFQGESKEIPEGVGQVLVRQSGSDGDTRNP